MKKESNLRKILNFGHTFAHAYEAALNYSKKLNHGEAVLLGINSAIKFSDKKKLLKKVIILQSKNILRVQNYQLISKNIFHLMI